MRTKFTTIRHKETGRVFHVLPGTKYPRCYEEVLPEAEAEAPEAEKDIRVGEPTVEMELEEVSDEKLDEAVAEAESGADEAEKPEAESEAPEAGEPEIVSEGVAAVIAAAKENTARAEAAVKTTTEPVEKPATKAKTAKSASSTSAKKGKK